jgi:hypothetical protein
MTKMKKEISHKDTLNPSPLCLRRVRTFLKKGSDTSKNFLLGCFLFSSFFRVPLCTFVAKK